MIYHLVNGTQFSFVLLFSVENNREQKSKKKKNLKWFWKAYWSTEKKVENRSLRCGDE